MTDQKNLPDLTHADISRQLSEGFAAVHKRIDQGNLVTAEVRENVARQGAQIESIQAETITAAKDRAALAARVERLAGPVNAVRSFIAIGGWIAGALAAFFGGVWSFISIVRHFWPPST